MAGLFLLLGAALWHGVPYFKAGRSLVLGERAIEHRDYRHATPYLVVWADLGHGIAIGILAPLAVFRHLV